jgi:uncharacterized membrane protein
MRHPSAVMPAAIAAAACAWHHESRLIGYETLPMSNVTPQGSRPPALSNTTLATIVYVLYLAAYFTGITAIIGVIIAHLRAGTSDPVLRSHYRFQIGTFWVGLLYLIVGGVLSFVLVGYLVLLWWFVWSLIRNIKGLLALNEGRPIDNPASWMFG